MLYASLRMAAPMIWRRRQCDKAREVEEEAQKEAWGGETDLATFKPHSMNWFCITSEEMP